MIRYAPPSIRQCALCDAYFTGRDGKRFCSRKCQVRAKRRYDVGNNPSHVTVHRDHWETAPPRKKPCKWCCDLSWHRPKQGGCGLCGKEYAPETIERWERPGFSAISLCERDA